MENCLPELRGVRTKTNCSLYNYFIDLKHQRPLTKSESKILSNYMCKHNIQKDLKKDKYIILVKNEHGFFQRYL